MLKVPPMTPDVPRMVAMLSDWGAITKTGTVSATTAKPKTIPILIWVSLEHFLVEPPLHRYRSMVALISTT